MSLESSVHQVREFVKVFAGLTQIGDALETALAAEQKAAAAEKRAAAAKKSADDAGVAASAAMAGADKIKAEADAMMAAAKSSAEEIRSAAKSKADATVAKAKSEADAFYAAVLGVSAKNDADRKAADEALSKVKAQIAHAEAKLSEIRQAIAKITGG